MCDFFNPTIEIVTFCLRGWSMLGVFLLPAFTHLGHECQDLWSMCDGMHACRLNLDWLAFVKMHELVSAEDSIVAHRETHGSHILSQLPLQIGLSLRVRYTSMLLGR